MPRQTKQYSYNRVQYANPDPYDLRESDIDGNILQLNVLGNDTLPRKGGLMLHSVDDGLGNTTNDLLNPDTWLSSMSAPDYLWGTTEQGNLVAIYNNTVVYKPTAAFMGVANIDDLTMNDVLTDSFTYAVRLSDNTLSWSTVTITLRGEGPDALDDTGGPVGENDTAAFNVLANDSALGQAQVISLGDSTLETPALGVMTFSGGDNPFSINSGTGQLDFNPGTRLDRLNDGETAQLTVSYVMTDATGQTSTATLRVTVRGENEFITGTSGTDTLATQGSGTLFGYAGNDVLRDEVAQPTGRVIFYGGEGADTLVGGPGYDEIHFDTYLAPGESDRLQGMNFTGDMIVLHGTVFSGLPVDGSFRLDSNAYVDRALWAPGTTAIIHEWDSFTQETVLSYASPATAGVAVEFARVDFMGSMGLDASDFMVSPSGPLL